MAGAVATTVVVWALLETRVADPHRVPLVLLIGLGLQFAAAPALTAVSRRWERAADRCSLELTGDRAAYETAFADSPAQASATSTRHRSSTYSSTYSCSRTRPRPSA
jgi:Zn-dependent protease with chaperone function